MARDESQREDLLREATALVERVEIVPHCAPARNFGKDSASGPIVAGFRANGAFSLFFGEDTVYQFNAASELRRAYVGGRLVKADRGRLIRLERIRKPHQVELRRHDLTADEQTAFLTQAAGRISELQALLNSGDFQVVGQVPSEIDVVGRVQKWFSKNRALVVATRPNA